MELAILIASKFKLALKFQPMLAHLISQSNFGRKQIQAITMLEIASPEAMAG
jgi:hypothetical protein